MAQISFAVRPADFELIEQIADRAERMAAKYRHPSERRTRNDYSMDLCATHANGCPLDLQKLLDADDFNFAHDVFGIERHLDRDDRSPTGGQLLDYFSPRCSLKQTVSA